MKKKLISVLLVLAALCTLCCGMALAAETRASDILSFSLVTIEPGSEKGKIKINYSVRCSMPATVGVESIEIYKSDDTYVTTICGTTGNGLLKSGVTRCSGTYTYTGTSGVTYYAVVTVSATAGSVYDSETVTTSTAKAP